MINTSQQSGNPTTLVNGDLWYDTATSKLRTVEAGAATNVTTGSHTHPLSEITDDGALAVLNTVGTTQIDDGAVTYAKVQDVSASQRVLGRNTTGAGDAEEVSVSQELDWLSSTRGSIPSRGASAWAGIVPVAAGRVLEDQGVGADPAWVARAISRGGTLYNSAGVVAVNLIVWRAPYACTVTNVRGYRVGGTGATVNARLNGASNHLSSALSLTSADTWADGGAVQNAAYATGDKLEIMVVSVTGTVTQVAIQVDFTRP